MLWNLGGVINCVIASTYKDRLNRCVYIGKNLYDDYSNRVGEYNQRNDLGFFTKVRSKREPNWKWIGFNTLGIELFNFEDAILGIDTYRWDRKEEKLNKIIDKLNDKLNALDNNVSLYEEKDFINRIRSKSESMEIDIGKLGIKEQESNIDIIIKRSRKMEKRILKRRL